MTDGFATRPKRGRSTAVRRRANELTTALLDQWSDHPTAQKYIRSQWAERLSVAHVINRRAQEAFYLARWLVVVGATIVPTLVVTGAQTSGSVATVAQGAAVVLSLLVAAAGGALQVTQMGQRWHLFLQLQYELEHAGVQLLMQRGEYANGDLNVRFAAFVDHIESIIRDYESSYSSQVVRLGRDEGVQRIAKPWPKPGADHNYPGQSARAFGQTREISPCQASHRIPQPARSLQAWDHGVTSINSPQLRNGPRPRRGSPRFAGSLRPLGCRGNLHTA
jgi:hypothetical protein